MGKALLFVAKRKPAPVPEKTGTKPERRRMLIDRLAGDDVDAREFVAKWIRDRGSLGHLSAGLAFAHARQRGRHRVASMCR